jgi:hypothetical protein
MQPIANLREGTVVVYFFVHFLIVLQSNVADVRLSDLQPRYLQKLFSDAPVLTRKGYDLKAQRLCRSLRCPFACPVCRGRVDSPMSSILHAATFHPFRFSVLASGLLGPQVPFPVGLQYDDSILRQVFSDPVCLRGGPEWASSSTDIRSPEAASHGGSAFPSEASIARRYLTQMGYFPVSGVLSAFTSRRQDEGGFVSQKCDRDCLTFDGTISHAFGALYC